MHRGWNQENAKTKNWKVSLVALCSSFQVSAARCCGEGETGRADLLDVDQFAELCQRMEEFKGSFYSGVTRMGTNGNYPSSIILHFTKQIVHPDSSEVVFHVVFVV